MRALAPGAAADTTTRIRTNPWPARLTTLVYVPAHVDRVPAELVFGGAAKLGRIVLQPDRSWIAEVAVQDIVSGAEYTVTLGPKKASAVALAALRRSSRFTGLSALPPRATDEVIAGAYRALALQGSFSKRSIMVK